MKINAVILSAIFFIASAILINCNIPANKVKDAKENITAVKNDLNHVKDYRVEIGNYQKEKPAKITDNEKVIADFKKKLNKRDGIAEYKKITQLEQENIVLKFTLENYKAEGKKEMACIQINKGKTATITENNYSLKK